MLYLLNPFMKCIQDEKIHTEEIGKLSQKFILFLPNTLETVADETAELFNISYQGNISIISR